MKNLAVWLFFGLVLACDACQTYRMFEMQKTIMVLEIRVEGLNKFSATLLECIHDIDRKIAVINPAPPAPTLPQTLELSHPLYRIPAEPINATPGGL